MNAIHVGYTDRIGCLSHLMATVDKKSATFDRQNKIMERANEQVKLLEAKISHVERQYNCAVQAKKRAFCYSLSLQLNTLEGVQHMFLAYTERLDDELFSLMMEINALLDEIAMRRRYIIGGILGDGINPVIGQVPRHLGSYSRVAAMDPPSREATGAHSPSQSPEATTVDRPSPEAASIHRPSSETASIHHPSPEAASTQCPSPEAASTSCPCPEGEGSDGGWSTVQRRKKGKKRRPQPNQQDQQSE